MTRSKEAFFTPWQAADYAGLKVDAMQELLASGEIASTTLNGQVRIRRSDLDAWLDAEVTPEELKQLAPKMRGVTEEEANELLKKHGVE